MTRKQAREEAFILIFEKTFNNNSIEELFELAVEYRDLKPNDYIREVVNGVFNNLDEIDALISKNAIGWKIERISKTTLCILRLAICEINYIDSIPASVSINEAVELCKAYSTKEDAGFVNGILSSVLKQQNNG